jgi:hypothetical protein
MAAFHLIIYGRFWVITEDGFAAKFTKLLFDSAGHYMGEADLVEELDVTGDAFTGTFTIQIHFLNNGPSLCSDEPISTEEALSAVFGSYKAEWLQERVFDFFTTPNYLPELSTARPCILLGGRGTGKNDGIQGPFL